MAKKQAVVSDNNLRPEYLEITNFKNISKKIVNIGGKSLLIIGPNETNKSSIIQAITGVLNSKNLPTETVKKGEENASITLKLKGTLHGQEEEYTISAYFTLKDQKGRLKLTNKLGEDVKSPATKIKDIIGAVSFDPTAWLRANKADKLKTIKQLTGRGVEIDQINGNIKKAKDAIRAKSDRAEELQGALNNHEFSQEDIARYSQPIDVSIIQNEYQQATQAQQVWDGVKNQVDKFFDAGNRATENISRAKTEILRLERLIEEQKALIDKEVLSVNTVNENIAKGQEWLKTNPRPDTTMINQRMTEAVDHNAKHQRIGMLSLQHQEMVKCKHEAEQLAVQVKTMEKDRDNLISGSQLPIAGLSFTEEELYIHGLPLEEGQQNTATIFDISVDVAIALNPHLKCIFLHDGSLFDKEHLRAIVNKIESHGYMAIIEMVRFEGGNDVEVIFTEQILN